MPTTTPVSQRELARFWWPLMATWLMMAVEGPFLAAVIARLPDPKPNLAAYGVAFAFAIILEAPVIMMLSAATALVTDRPRYVALRRFATGLNIAVTASVVVVLATPLGAWMLGDVLRLGPQVARLTWTALLLLIPWPAAIGYRRFYQGVLIRGGRPRLVAVGTIARLSAMAATGIALSKGTDWPGAWVGAGALSVGVCAEALAVRMMVGPVLARLAPGAGGTELTQRAILEFYAPLALTSTITLAVQPLATFFMGQARSPLESLAVLPVVNSFVFVFRTFGLSFQEMAIARLDESAANLAPVRRFAVALATVASTALALIAFTPAVKVWFEGVSGLSPDLAAFAVPPTRLLALMPAFSVLLAWQWALLVWGRRTRSITAASLVEVAVIAVVLFGLVHGAGLVGVTAAAAAFLIGRMAGTATLVAPCRAAIRARLRT
jgi:progressive ankylosis protein